MRKGFTMIELIFVIVILGILAAVAIPRLAATRDDAEISKAATNIQTMVSDLGSFYTSQGNFSSTMTKMTGVQNPVKVKSEVCFNLTNPQANGTVSVAFGTGPLCSKVWDLPGLKELKTNIEGNSNKLSFGGQGVKY